MNKINLLLPIGFFAMLSGGLATHLLLPDRSISEMENRPLTAAPTSPTTSAILSGEWSKQVEAYFSDQFPEREAWMKAFVKTELAVGKTYINEKYYADFNSGWITSGPAELQDEDALDNAARNVFSLKKKLDELGVPFIFYSLPAKATYVREPHPSFMQQDAGLENNARFLSKLRELDISSERLMDSMRKLEPELNVQELYFKSDHHWNINGAVLGYQALVHDLTRKGVPLSGEPMHKKSMDLTCLPHPFEGSWNKFYHMLVPNDDQICYLEPEGIADRFIIRATSVTGTSTAEYENIYGAGRKLQSDKPVNYSIGYTSDYPELDIRNSEIQNGHVVILKDSYFNPITFLMAHHFNRTTVIDLRYYEGDLSQWLAEEKPDSVIMAYNDRNFDMGFN